MVWLEMWMILRHLPRLRNIGITEVDYITGLCMI